MINRLVFQFIQLHILLIIVFTWVIPSDALFLSSVPSISTTTATYTGNTSGILSTPTLPAAYPPPSHTSTFRRAPSMALLTATSPFDTFGIPHTFPAAFLYCGMKLVFQNKNKKNKKCHFTLGEKQKKNNIFIKGY